MEIDRTRPTPKSFWSYRAPPASSDPPPGVEATRAEWLQLSPGYRREIARQIEWCGDLKQCAVRPVKQTPEVLRSNLHLDVSCDLRR